MSTGYEPFQHQMAAYGPTQSDMLVQASGHYLVRHQMLPVRVSIVS